MRRPLAEWPGLPRGEHEVYAPVDAQGELWGPREHGILYVDARRPEQPRSAIATSITWERMTVRELCERLPDGADSSVRCSGTEELLPALDPTERLRHLQVRRLASDDAFAALARHQGAPDAYVLTRAGGSSAEVLLLAVAHERAERSARDFADDCTLARVARPAALWRRDDLPRRLRTRLDEA